MCAARFWLAVDVRTVGLGLGLGLRILGSCPKCLFRDLIFIVCSQDLVFVSVLMLNNKTMFLS